MPKDVELEGSFGFLTEQVKSVHKDLLAFEARTEARFEKVDDRFDNVSPLQLQSKIIRILAKSRPYWP